MYILFQHFPQFNPDIVMLAFCHSLSSDVAMVLRSQGVFGGMFINNDRRTITGKSWIEMDSQQKALMDEIGELRVGKNILQIHK